MSDEVDRDGGPADAMGNGETAGGAAPDDEGGSQALAVVVEQTAADSTIGALRAEGVYDDERRVRSYDEKTVALPVTEPPTQTPVRDVIRQIDPAYRTRTLEDRLAARGWSNAEIAAAPSSWAVVGSVILVTVPADCPDETALAEALLDLHGEADSVLADEGIAETGRAGIVREPRTRHLAGETDTETVHTEAGTRYGLDPARVMFSPGNQAERVRMGSVVEEATAGTDKTARSGGSARSDESARTGETARSDGSARTDGSASAEETVFDMFAGIGYFTLPMARAGARVIATEINPTAFRYLLENAVLNDVTDRIDAYHTDCRSLAADVAVDRVVMGYYGDDVGGPASDEVRQGPANYLPAALEAVRDGGIVHYHEATPESRLWDRPVDRIETAVADAGRSFTVLDRRRVKSYSAGVSHVVLDVQVD